MMGSNKRSFAPLIQVTLEELVSQEQCLGGALFTKTKEWQGMLRFYLMTALARLQ
jgi:hypothetical protein